MTMAPAVDPAILKALGLDAETTRMNTHGGSGFASTFKLWGTVDGGEKTFFVKTGSGKDAETMFTGEHASLNAIHSAVPDFCPASHAHGPMSSEGRFFLATDFLDLGGRGASGTGKSLAAKLAQLHRMPAPVPEGFDRPMFGFPVSTCCGPTVQNNSWKGSWADFYADNRLRHILAAGTRNNGKDAELERTVEAVASKVVPRLLGDGHLKNVQPVVVHGDLWSGNHGAGIMNMFGGFGPGFWDEYGRLVPKSEPVEEFEDRVALYELYHHLNHFAIFGAGYRGGAMSIMKKLISKYG